MRPVESMRSDAAGAGARIAVIDMGTNSTRLLVADVPKEGQTPFRVLTEIDRRSTVTRLGRGVDTSGTLAAEAIEDCTANLRAPILIVDGRGFQVINQVADSPVRIPLLAGVAESAGQAA